MNVTFYATKPMARFLKRCFGMQVERLPCDDPKAVGRVPLLSSPTHVAWQLHVVQTNRDHRDEVIIAIEASSRYVVLIPADWRLRTVDDLESLLMDRWIEELLLLKAQTPHLGTDQTDTVLGHLLTSQHQTAWLTNTDLSINGHLTDTDHWIASELHHRRRSILQPQDARDLAWYLNTQPKRLTRSDGIKSTIVPAEEMILLCLMPYQLM